MGTRKFFGFRRVETVGPSRSLPHTENIVLLQIIEAVSFSLNIRFFGTSLFVAGRVIQYHIMEKNYFRGVLVGAVTTIVHH